MADPGGSDPRAPTADLDALPGELARQSISKSVIMLPLDGAIQAIEHLSQHGRRLENWEGWVRMRDGTRAKSLGYTGSFALSRDPSRAAETAIAAMRSTSASWDRNPEYPGATLYFALSFGAV